MPWERSWIKCVMGKNRFLTISFAIAIAGAGVLLYYNLREKGPFRALINPIGENGARGVVEIRLAENGEFEAIIEIENLKTGAHGLHILQTNECKAGPSEHFDDGRNRHGSPRDPEHHTGDLGNIIATASGKASAIIVMPSFDPRDMIGKALVVTKNVDDYRSQPFGNSGSVSGCGLIMVPGN